MNKLIQTDKAPAPFSAYAQAMETPAGARIIHVSGQAGNAPDGTLSSDPAEQNEQAWRNIFAILEAADMDKTDIVEVIAIVTDHSGVPLYREVRDKMLNGHVCASTMLVCGLASEDWKVEIAVRAGMVV